MKNQYDNKDKCIMFTIDTNTSGGAERVISILANYFAQENYRVILVNSDKSSSFYPIDSKIKVIKMGLDTNRKGVLFSTIRFIQKTIKLFSLTKIYNPDAIVTFLFNMEAPTIIVGLLRRIPTYASVRNSVQSFSKSINLFRNITYRYIDGVVFQSDIVRNDKVYKRTKNSCVIMNPLSANLENVHAVQFCDRIDWIINVGRLHLQKNQKMLIESFAEFVDEYPDFELHIFGEGDLRNELQATIENLNLQGKVILEGSVADALLLHKNAKCFVLSSNFEGFPNSLVEAMAVGIPVISTDFDSGIAKHWVENGVNGYLFAVGQKDALTICLKELISLGENSDKMVQISQEKVKEIYPRSVCKQWEKFIFGED